MDQNSVRVTIQNPSEEYEKTITLMSFWREWSNEPGPLTIELQQALEQLKVDNWAQAGWIGLILAKQYSTQQQGDLRLAHARILCGLKAGCQVEAKKDLRAYFAGRNMSDIFESVLTYPLDSVAEHDYRYVISAQGLPGHRFGDSFDGNMVEIMLSAS